MKFTTLDKMRPNDLDSRGVELISGNRLAPHGSPIPVLSGEVQFFRMDPSVWEPCLMQVKNLGLPIVSTYLSWRRFSKGPGQFDLTGESDPRLNVPGFLELCKKTGLYVTMKPGPWICAEETNGGYPDWLVNQPGLQVLDAENNPVKGYNYPFQSPIPSYFHQDYQCHVQEWLAAVDRVIKPYCYPDGPILLIQLDNEPGFTFHDRMFESDYNPVITEKGVLYSQWLSEKYETVESLNQHYGSSYEKFDEILPPRKLELKNLIELNRYMDWVEFKETLLANHVASIGRFHLQNGIDRVLFTINYNFHPQLAMPNHWHALECESGMGGFDYYPSLPMDVENFVDMVQAVNYSRAVNRVVWSPEIMCGIWNFEGSEHSSNHLASKEYEYLYLTCLAYGLKGMNFYMLADRDNWVNSPINDRGQLTGTSSAVKNTVKVMKSIPSFSDLQVEQKIGVVYSRLDAREAFIVNEIPAKVNGHLLGETYSRFTETYRLLIESGINAGIVDLDIDPERLVDFSILFAPMNETTDAKYQQILLEYVKQGGCLVCLNGLPARDWDGSPAEVLQNGWNGSPEIQEFASYSFARIGKGSLIQYKETHLEDNLLQEWFHKFRAEPGVFASDRRIKTTVQKSRMDWVCFVINTAGEDATVELTFDDFRNETLADVLVPECKLEIVEGKSTLEIPARSVRVFWKKLA